MSDQPTRWRISVTQPGYMEDQPEATIIETADEAAAWRIFNAEVRHSHAIVFEATGKVARTVAHGFASNVSVTCSVGTWRIILERVFDLDGRALEHETLLTLAAAAEYMASESTAADRNGRCSAYLYEAGRTARRAAGFGQRVAGTTRTV